MEKGKKRETEPDVRKSNFWCFFFSEKSGPCSRTRREKGKRERKEIVAIRKQESSSYDNKVSIS